MGCGCEHYLGFRVEEEISRLRAFGHQCRGIIASCAFMASARADLSFKLAFYSWGSRCDLVLLIGWHLLPGSLPSGLVVLSTVTSGFFPVFV
jgi:hypothetical protein